MTAISDPPDQALSTNGATQSPAVEAREITAPADLATAVSMPSDFRFDEVRAVSAAAPSATPALGPLAAFHGNWHGSGFNTIFRPDNPETPTKLPVPVSGSDNVLELNLTHETLSLGGRSASISSRACG